MKDIRVVLPPHQPPIPQSPDIQSFKPSEVAEPVLGCTAQRNTQLHAILEPELENKLQALRDAEVDPTVYDGGITGHKTNSSASRLPMREDTKPRCACPTNEAKSCLPNLAFPASPSPQPPNPPETPSQQASSTKLSEALAALLTSATASKIVLVIQVPLTSSERPAPAAETATEIVAPNTPSKCDDLPAQKEDTSAHQIPDPPINLRIPSNVTDTKFQDYTHAKPMPIHHQNDSNNDSIKSDNNKSTDEISALDEGYVSLEDESIAEDCTVGEEEVEDWAWQSEDEEVWEEESKEEGEAFGGW